MKTAKVLFTVLLFMLLFAACTPGMNDQLGNADAGGNVAGFWRGLWHGMIIVFTFIGSLFTDQVSVYEVHNNGAWYNFGYLLGAMIALGGGSHGATRRSRGSFTGGGAR